MTPAYMPFTHLSESTARLLFALVGPVVIYQPLKTQIPKNLSSLASQGFIEIRTPMAHDDDRLRAALVEFKEWARLNPGKSTPGPGFVGVRQGQVPFFDDDAISQIRSEIKHYHESGEPADETDASFSARLFLALAQENDLAVDHLDQDLDRFKALEKDFLETLEDADDAGFSRQAYAGRLWREDPGAKLTGQRIRAWARLAITDGQLPNVLITTSPAVVEALAETHGDDRRFKKLPDLRLPLPSDASAPVLGPVLDQLANGEIDPSEDLSTFALPAPDRSTEAGITASFYVVAHQTPAIVLGTWAAGSGAPARPSGPPESVGRTLVVLLKG